MTTLDNLGTCETCGGRRAVAVASLPGIPMSVGVCQECIYARAIPLWAAVANTAAIGGMDGAAEWWRNAVEDTLTHLHVSREEFDRQVAAQIAEFDLLAHEERL